MKATELAVLAAVGLFAAFTPPFATAIGALFSER